MLNPCLDCGTKFAGLWWTVPDDAWRAAVGPLDAGELCPWCFNDRAAARGLHVDAKVSLSLSNVNALSLAVMDQLEALDRRIAAERIR